MPRSTRKPKVYQQAHSTNWWLRYYDEHNKLVRESAETTDERAAWRRLEERLREVEERRAVANQHCPVETGFDLFMATKTLKAESRKRYETSLAHWLLFCDQNALTDFTQITKKMVGRFIEWRKLTGVTRKRAVLQGGKRALVDVRQDVTEATIRRDLAFFSSVWSFLADHHDWEDHMPEHCPISKGQKKGLKESRKRVRFATTEEWQAIMNATTAEYQRQILTLAVETGMREQELCKLLWTQVDLGRRQIVLTPDVVDTKNDLPRVIPLTDLAMQVLTCIVRHKRAPWVFWHLARVKTEGGYEMEPHRFGRFSNWWKHTRRRSGVQNFKFHDIRHTFASNFLNDGGDIAVLKEILGHSSLQVTERYAHMITRRLHEEVRKREKNRSITSAN